MIYTHSSPFKSTCQILFILICLGLCLPSFAQATPYYKAYLFSYPQSAVYALKEPLRWESSEWLAAGGVVLITGALYFVDEPLRDWVQNNQTPALDHTALVFRQFGDVHILLPAAGLSALAGWGFDSPKLTDTGLLSLKSLLIAGSVTNALKFLSQRQRPSANQGNEFFNGKGFKFSRDSFPSGHSTLAWSLVPIVAEQYSDSGWVAPLAYGIATLTSLSRVYDDRHWISDVFAGAVVGYLAGRLTLVTTPRLWVDPSSQSLGLQIEF